MRKTGRTSNPSPVPVPIIWPPTPPPSRKAKSTKCWSGCSNLSSGSPRPSDSSRSGLRSPRFTTSVHDHNMMTKVLKIDEFGSMDSDNEEDITCPGSMVDTHVGRIPTNESMLSSFGLPSNKSFLHPEGSESRSLDLTRRSSRDKEFTSYSSASKTPFPKDPQLAMQTFIEALKNPDSFKNKLNSRPMNRHVQTTNSSSVRGLLCADQVDISSSTDEKRIDQTFIPSGLQAYISNKEHQAAALNSNFRANTVPPISFYAPNQDFWPNTNVGLSTNAFIPKELSYVQNEHIGIPGHFMASSEQGFIQNTNMGPSASSVYWSQANHNDVESATISPSVNEVTMTRVPDGTGSLKYPAPDPDSLTFDPEIGYRYDAKTGLHYDANSGYFFNSKLKIFLQWDFFKETYLRVEKHLLPSPVLRNQKDSSENDSSRSRSGSRNHDRERFRSRKRRASHSRSVSPVHSTIKRGDRHRSPSNDRRRRLLRSPQRRRTHSKSPPGLSKKWSSPGPSSRRSANRNRSRSSDNRRRQESRSPLRRSPPRGSFTKRREECRRRSKTPDRMKTESHSVPSVEKYGRCVEKMNSRWEKRESISPHVKGSSSQEVLLVSLPPKSKWELNERITPKSCLVDSLENKVEVDLEKKSPQRSTTLNYQFIENKHQSSSPKKPNTEKSTDSYEESVICKTKSFSRPKVGIISCWKRKSRVDGSTSGNENQKSLTGLQTHGLFCGRELKSMPSCHLNTYSCVKLKDEETKRGHDPPGLLDDHSQLADLNCEEDKEECGERLNEESPELLPANDIGGEVGLTKSSTKNYCLGKAWGGTRVPGDTDPLSDLYDSEPTHLVHMKSPTQGFTGHVIKESIRQHLFIENVKPDKIAVQFKNTLGSPFEFIEVTFKSLFEAKLWFHTTKRKITLQCTEEMKADYFLYYAGKSWHCKNCANGHNIFFRSLCHWCYCHKSGSSSSVRISNFPTRFLGIGKLPCSINGNNVMQHLPEMIRKCRLKSVRIHEDPEMNCCSGLVVIEMLNIGVAMDIQRSCLTPDSRHVLRYVEIDDYCPSSAYLKVICQDDLDRARELSSVVAHDIQNKQDSDVKQQNIMSDENDTSGEIAGNVSADRVPGDTCPFSDLYYSSPSRLVHVKSPTCGFNVNKQSILHYLSTNDVEYERFSVTRIDDFGNPIEYIEVVFKSSNQAEKWFLKTNRKITLQAIEAVKVDYYLYYAGECWECKNCGRVRNVFFRSLCHLCYCHKSGFFTSVRFSDAPTRFLGFCKLPYSTNKRNFRRHLPKVQCDWQKCDFKSVRVIEDPGMNCCCGIVVVEMINVDEAMHIQQIVSRSPQVLGSCVLIRYIEQDCEKISETPEEFLLSLKTLAESFR